MTGRRKPGSGDLRQITAGLATVAVVSVVWGPSAAAAAPATGGTCLGAAVAQVTVAAGGLSSTRAISVRYTGRDIACHMSDPTIRSATEVGSGTGTFNCSKLGGLEAGVDTFTWSNGRRSVLTYTDTVVAGVGITKGTIIRGEFKGLRVRYAGPTIPSPEICTSPRGGVFGGLYAGTGAFGRAL